MTAPTLSPALRSILERVDPDRCNSGICFGMSAELRGEFLEACKAWPKHSGNPEFPVPHPNEGPRSAYIGTPNLWEGQYGDNRRELLAWLLGKTPVVAEKPALVKKIFAIPKL